MTKNTHSGVEMSCSNLNLQTADSIKRCAEKGGSSSYIDRPHDLEDGDLQETTRDKCRPIWKDHFKSEAVPDAAMSFCNQQITPSVEFWYEDNKCERFDP